MKSVSTLVFLAGITVTLPPALYVADWLFAQRQPSFLPRYTVGDLIRQMRLWEEISADQRIVHQVLSEKLKIVDELIEGRRSLVSAAECIRALDEMKPPHLRIHLEGSIGEFSEDYFLRMTIKHVDISLRGDSRHDVFLARLQAELQEYQRRPTAPLSEPRP